MFHCVVAEGVKQNCDEDNVDNQSDFVMAVEGKRVFTNITYICITYVCLSSDTRRPILHHVMCFIQWEFVDESKSWVPQIADCKENYSYA